MKKHQQVYFDYYDIDKGDFVACENCGKTAVDIHHLKFRSQGGQDVIENLMAVCRPCHVFYGDKKQYKEYLKEKHENALSKVK